MTSGKVYGDKITERGLYVNSWIFWKISQKFKQIFLFLICYISIQNARMFSPCPFLNPDDSNSHSTAKLGRNKRHAARVCRLRFYLWGKPNGSLLKRFSFSVQNKITLTKLSTSAKLQHFPKCLKKGHSSLRRVLGFLR